MGSGAMAKMIKKRYPDNKVQILSRKDNSYDKPIKGDILITSSGPITVGISGLLTKFFTSKK